MLRNVMEGMMSVLFAMHVSYIVMKLTYVRCVMLRRYVWAGTPVSRQVGRHACMEDHGSKSVFIYVYLFARMHVCVWVYIVCIQ